MSNSRPHQYSDIAVNVRSTAAAASVRTVAHYKSTTTAHTGRTDRHGKASIAYHISRATLRYTVKVAVTVTSGKKTASCSTSFTPR